MSIIKKHINVVWFKRDLRLQDNEAFFNATKTGIPTLFLYVFEKSLKMIPITARDIGILLSNLC
jgi:deoxyribodipyrimidine photo-lyase